MARDGAAPRGGSPDIWERIRERVAEMDRDQEQAESPEDLLELWRRRALELSRAPGRAGEEGEALRLIVFRLGTDRHAVPVTAVREIQRVGRITPVSTAPPHVAGLMNLRGSILPVIDLRVLLGIERVAAEDRARILVVESGGSSTGIRVDAVDEIAEFPPGAVAPPLAASGAPGEEWVAGIVTLRGSMVVLFDLDGMLGAPRLVVDEPV